MPAALEPCQGREQRPAHAEEQSPARLGDRAELLHHRVLPEADPPLGVRDPASDVCLDEARPSVAELDREVGKAFELRQVPRPGRRAGCAVVAVQPVGAVGDPRRDVPSTLARGILRRIDRMLEVALRLEHEHVRVAVDHGLGAFGY